MRTWQSQDSHDGQEILGPGCVYLCEPGKARIRMTAKSARVSERKGAADLSLLFISPVYLS
jgi:hypothetical protein